MTITEDTAPRDGPADELERTPGEPDMWFFVLFESVVFTSYFCVYLYLRTQNEAAFLDAQSALHLPLGIVDTILLLTSSWTMARCALHARSANHSAAQHYAYLTAGLGAAFLAIKVIEWVSLIDEGHTFASSEFMTHFFFLTGMHAIHLLIGFVVLGVLIRQLANQRRRSLTTIETCTTYWHSVDLYWVIIFALLYVAR
jgi:nitric oxide reductase NorE protein